MQLEKEIKVIQDHLREKEKLTFDAGDDETINTMKQ